MNAAERRRLSEATALLKDARLMLGSSEDALLSAAGALIDCAAQAASAVAQDHPDSAQTALSCARGAVVTASYLVRGLADARKRPLQQEATVPVCEVAAVRAFE